MPTVGLAIIVAFLTVFGTVKPAPLATVVFIAIAGVLITPSIA